MSHRWSPAEADEYLRTHQVWGMRFGLDRIRRLMTVLGQPQKRFAAIHVVGTNGKSSTTRMTAAVLERHGLRTGVYTSPHLVSYTERIEVAEQPLPADEFAWAIERAARAGGRVQRTLPEGETVTQFEVLTAAALLAMADRRVEVAVVEAGLGGRYDATSVIDARVAVLTGVGLEHTRWLGPTVAHIAAEKLAVLRPGSTLVVGAGVPDEVAALARQVSEEQGATLRFAPAEPPPGIRLRARGEFQRRNFALAVASAEAFLGHPPDAEAVRDAARSTLVRGRLEVMPGDPLTVIDGAHNPDSIRALVASLPAVVGDRPLSVVLSVLDDKDTPAMLEPLRGASRRLLVTRCDSPRALPPDTIAHLARQVGFADVHVLPRPVEALARARALAGAEDGAVLVCGSIYLAGELRPVLEGDPDAEATADGEEDPAARTRIPQPHDRSGAGS